MPKPDNTFETQTIKDSSIWKQNLNHFPHSVFITSEWLQSLADRNHSPIYLNIYLNKNLIGKAAGFIITKHKANDQQLYFYAGPAVIDEDHSLYIKCIDELYKYARKNSFSRVIIGSYGNNHSLCCTSKYFYQNERSEYVINLGKGFNAIQTTKRFKRNIKKGAKVNPKIIKSQDPKLLLTLQHLLSSTKNIRIKKYSTHYNPFYLKNLSLSTLEKLLHSKIGYIYYTLSNNQIHCMEFNIEVGSNVYMLLKGTDDYGYKNGLSSHLSHYLTQKYIKEGKSVYNQGGRPQGKDGDGLSIFKKSMGAREVTVYGATTNYITYPYKLLNPILNLGRLLPDVQLVKYLKRLI